MAHKRSHSRSESENKRICNTTSSGYDGLEGELKQISSFLRELPDMFQQSFRDAIRQMTSTLGEKLDKILDHMEKNVHNSATLTNGTNHNTYSPPISDESIKMSLCSLKHERNDAVYKRTGNEMRAKIYADCIEELPRRVPHKFTERVYNNDNEKMIQLKMEVTTQKVQNTINSYKIHVETQQQKISRIEEKSKSILEKISSDDERLRATDRWKKLAQYGEQNAKQK